MSHYFNEFVFRFNRRRSRSRGMVFYRVLELAVAHEPMRFQDLIARGSCPPSRPNGEGIPRAWNAQGQTGRGGRRPNTDGGRDALRLNGYPQSSVTDNLDSRRWER